MWKTAVAVLGPCLLAACLATDVRPDERPPRRPNVLWIVAEDLSPDFACFGNDAVRTPTIDRLASQGVMFTNVIMPAPVCSPCRSALITGVMQTTTGTHQHHSSRTEESAIHLPDHVRTVPELFRDAGYFTFNSGKDDYNFEYDRSDLYAGEHLRHPLYGKLGRAIDWTDRPDPDQPFFGQIQLYGGKHIFKSDEAFRARVERPVDRDAMVLPPYYPRSPLMVEAWAKYLESIQITDREVADILARLEEDGELDDTLVVFFADHGARFLRHKQFLYEGGVRAPLVMAWGRNLALESERLRDELVSGLDIPATSLRAAGIELPAYFEGADLLAPSHAPRTHVISARDRCDFTVDRIRSVRTERFKYIRNFMTDRPAMQPNYRDEWELTAELRGMHARGELDAYQAAHFSADRAPEELYDLATDPHELVNLAGDPTHEPELLRHRAILDAWVTSSGDRGEEPEGAAGLRVMLGIWGVRAVNPEYDALRAAEPELAGSLWDSLKQQPFLPVDG